ncbi:hypothetical protein ALP59_101610 [Pseudomonas savastanoi]|uniref:Uncharacterized protein n=2 Tax=Pseudomonas savastanoi TaxID=29438 RepID=A0A3M5FLD4_PSESS|nr:hypothetical protein ALP59_101610 [Pseudomonas savastanoi]
MAAFGDAALKTGSDATSAVPGLIFARRYHAGPACRIQKKKLRLNLVRLNRAGGISQMSNCYYTAIGHEGRVVMSCCDFKERIMSSNANLTCNFTISSSLNVGVSFESDNGGGSYGGQITVFTPATVQPVTTGLWDNDGNVFFTLYLTDNPDISCVINSGSEPGSWVPYITSGQESGLTCEISSPQPAGENIYNYTLTVTQTSASTAASIADPKPKYVATLFLPVGGMQAWTQIMQGGSPVPDEINSGSPIVMAFARYSDGTVVAGGVYKSDSPTDYNIKFMWVFDGEGNQYPGWPIDVSDDEDFSTQSYIFSLTPDSEELYQLNIVDSPLRERP